MKELTAKEERTVRDLDLKDLAKDAAFLYNRYRAFERDMLPNLKKDILKAQEEYKDIPAATGVFNAIGSLIMGAYNEQIYIEKVKKQRELIRKKFFEDLNNEKWINVTEQNLDDYLETFDVLKGAKSFDAKDTLRKIISELQGSRKTE